MGSAVTFLNMQMEIICIQSLFSAQLFFLVFSLISIQHQWQSCDALTVRTRRLRDPGVVSIGFHYVQK